MSLVRTLSHLKWGADRQSLLRIYRAVIRSKIDYGSQVYGSAKPNVLKILDPVHTMALRYCTRAFRSSPVVSLCAESGEPPLQHRRDQPLLQHYLRIYRLPNSPAYNAVFDPVVVDPYEGNASIPAPFAIRARRLIANVAIHGIDVLSYLAPSHPPWKLYANICPQFTELRKKETAPYKMQMLFLEHLLLEHADSMQIYTDGSKVEEGVGYAYVTGESIKSAKIRKD